MELRGYPPYLRDEPGITIRTWNEPYQCRVEKYFQHLVPEFRPHLASNGGVGWNYYMWHGGTNFGRTSMYLGPTSYDFDAPLDEFGRFTLKGEYLRRLHGALNANAAFLLKGERTRETLADGQERVVWRRAERSIKVILDSKTRRARLLDQAGGVLFDTEADFAAARRTFRPPPWKAASPFHGWRAWREPMPSARADDAVKAERPIEQLLLTHDETDYCWYGPPFRNGKRVNSSLKSRMPLMP